MDDEDRQENDDIESKAQRLEEILQVAEGIRSEVQGYHAEVKAAQETAATSLGNIQSHEDELTTHAETANQHKETIEQYKEELAALKRHYEDLKAHVEGLLPGATGVGLAKSFNERKEALTQPIYGFLVLFLVAIIGFVLFGVWIVRAEDVQTFSDLVIFALERSPILVGLILLEEFARRKFNELWRLQEDYAYKETLSISFDGYKQALSDVDTDTDSSMTSKLSANVLDAINQRPGRLADSEREDSTSPESVLAMILAANRSEDEHHFSALSRFSRALQKHLTHKWILVAVIVVVATSAGVAIGYFIW